MEEGRPSSTAVFAAMQRAVHLHMDAAPKIFEDTLALGLGGFESVDALRHRYEETTAEWARRSDLETARNILPRVRTTMVTRARYVEDQLEAAEGRGISQYVILGAGLDSCAYRRNDLAQAIKIYEVDHPASQAWKRARLDDLGIELPRNLTFVPLDFEKRPLLESLLASGFRPERPTFFSWLGVTHYITEDAVFSTLRAVASLASGTEIIFDYGVPSSMLDDEGRKGLSANNAYVASVGEPWITYFQPQRLAARLCDLGFEEVWDFGILSKERTPYLPGQSDWLGPTSGVVRLMGARVGPPR